jgi:hypothetical protein
MTTECTQFVFGFHPQKRREIRAQFDGGAITSDGGGLLLREVGPPSGGPATLSATTMAGANRTCYNVKSVFHL